MFDFGLYTQVSDSGPHGTLVSFLFRLGLCVQLVLLMNQQYYHYCTFSFTFAFFLDFVRKRLNGVGIPDTGISDSEVGLNNGYSLSEISKSAGLLG